MSDTDLTARAREIAAGLDEGARVCLQLAAIVPWVDLGGDATRMGIIDERGRQTDLGRAVAAVLAEGGAP